MSFLYTTGNMMSKFSNCPKMSKCLGHGAKLWSKVICRTELLTAASPVRTELCSPMFVLQNGHKNVRIPS